jgi:hypothetical protein
VHQIRWRWVPDSALASVRVQALGCTVGCTGSACLRRPGPARPSRSCHPLGRGRCVRAREATAQRLGLDSGDSAEIIVQRGGRAPAWKAVTMPCQTSANAGHRHRAGPANDRECPCLTLRSGTYRARTRLRRPPLRASQSMPLTCWYACGTDAHSENRSAHVPDHGWRCVRERLYSPSLQTESNTADQHKLGPSQYPGLPPSAMRPSVQGSGGLRVTDGARSGTDGAGRNGHADRRPAS